MLNPDARRDTRRTTWNPEEDLPQNGTKNGEEAALDLHSGRLDRVAWSLLAAIALARNRVCNDLTELRAQDSGSNGVIQIVFFSAIYQGCSSRDLAPQDMRFAVQIVQCLSTLKRADGLPESIDT